MMLERVTPGVRGELTRWLLEVRAGVFVGTVNAAVRQRLWEFVLERLGTGAGVLVYSSPTEQGFDFQLWGTPTREVVDFDGLHLIRRSTT